MKRKEAIETIIRSIKDDDVVVSATGLISREVFEKFDSERNIYVPGSMGLASSIGLGLASANTQRRIIVLDGDASILMNLGSMVTIGKRCPKNLLHIVIDNRAYGSCSEEASMSDTASLEEIARIVGYAYVQVASDQINTECAILNFSASGSGFILVKVELGGRRNFRRPLDLVSIKNRFKLFAL